MEEILHANIFFFVTGIAVIVITALLCVALFHMIKVLKSLRRIMVRVEAEADALKDDMQQLREYFTGNGLLRRLATKLMGKQTSQSDESEGQKEKTAVRKKSELKIKDQG